MRLYGDSLMNEHKFAEGIEYFTTIANNESNDWHLRAHALAMVGVAYVAQQNADKALEVLNSCCTRFPKDVGKVPNAQCDTGQDVSVLPLPFGRPSSQIRCS